MIHCGSVMPVLVAFITVGTSVLAFAQAPPTWTELGNSATGGGISNTQAASIGAKVAVGPDGLPVVAWHEDTPSGLAVYLRKWNGSSWAELGGSASGAGISTGLSNGGESIAIDANGAIFVAFHHWDGQYWDIHVVRWNGTTWSGIGGSALGGGISNTSKPSEFPSIAVDAEGRPWVAWVETNGSDEAIYLKGWNGIAWVEVGGSGSGGGISSAGAGLVSTYPSLAMDRQGMPVVAWEQKTGNLAPSMGSGSVIEIYLRRWDGNAWVEIGGSATGGGISVLEVAHCYNPMVTVDLQNRPVVAWTGPGPEKRPEVFLRRWSGSAWIEPGGSATSYGISGQRPGLDGGEQWATCTGLALDLQGNPIVSWTEGSDSIPYQVRARRWTGAAWEGIEGTDDVAGLGSSDAFAGAAAIAVAPSGDAFIAWGEGPAGSQEIHLRGWRNVRTFDLGQFESDGATAVGVGSATSDANLVFRGRASRDLVSFPLRLQFEIRRIGEAFTGVPSGETELQPSGDHVSLALASFLSAGYHWRARAVESTGFVSAWEPFGGNTENYADLWVKVPGNAGSEEESGGGSRGGGCGLIGPEGPLLLGLWVWLRRRKGRGTRSAVAGSKGG